MESTFSNDISAKMSQRLITIADMLKASDDIKAPEVVADVVSSAVSVVVEAVVDSLVDVV